GLVIRYPFRGPILKETTSPNCRAACMNTPIGSRRIAGSRRRIGIPRGPGGNVPAVWVAFIVRDDQLPSRVSELRLGTNQRLSCRSGVVAKAELAGGQRLPVQRQQAAPGLLGLRLVVDAGIRRA